MRELVVIGNGMVGARAVEEILARGGGVMFRITMFGDEPHGNYNRILLSELLARGTDPDEDPLALTGSPTGFTPTTGRSSGTTSSCWPPAAAPTSRRWRACGRMTRR
jgi:hypothetical protein